MLKVKYAIYFKSSKVSEHSIMVFQGSYQDLFEKWNKSNPDFWHYAILEKTVEYEIPYYCKEKNWLQEENCWYVHVNEPIETYEKKLAERRKVSNG